MKDLTSLHLGSFKTCLFLKRFVNVEHLFAFLGIKNLVSDIFNGIYNINLLEKKEKSCRKVIEERYKIRPKWERSKIRPV